MRTTGWCFSSSVPPKNIKRLPNVRVTAFAAFTQDVEKENLTYFIRLLQNVCADLYLAASTHAYRWVHNPKFTCSEF